MYFVGSVILNFNNFFLVLVIMSLFILGLILISEMNFNLKFLSLVLVMFSCLFFFSFNIFYFYLFFEFSVFPILIMILGFGYQIEKISASYYLLFYTFICSLPFFFFIFNLDLSKSFLNFSFVLSWEMEFIITVMFMLKFPVYFLHLWLPKAHVEAPTTASMLLAGLLLKLGTGGFVRIILTLNYMFLGYYYLISFLGMILSNFNCIMQSDLKSLAAYSSVNHMSFVLLGLVFFSSFSLMNSVIVMLLHGFISTLMFYFIGEYYHVSNTRLIYYYSGVFSSSLFFLVIISLVWLFNGGVPPSLSFFSEFSIFLVLFTNNIFLLVLGILYFFMSFYYCLFFISLNFLGKNFLALNSNICFYSLFFSISSGNLFFFFFFL